MGTFLQFSLADITMHLSKLLGNTGDESAVVLAGIISTRKARRKGCGDKFLYRV